MRIIPFSNQVQFIPKDSNSGEITPAAWFTVTSTDIATAKSGAGGSTANIADPNNSPGGGGGAGTSLEDLIPLINNVSPREDTFIQLLEPTTVPFSLICMSQTKVKRSTFGIREHKPFERISGSIGITRSGK